jgi:hypothetical protein
LLYSDEKKPDDITNDMESPMVINISEYHPAEMYNKAEVQVFQKQLKQLTTVHYVITQKEYCMK